jgi:spore germination protein GerM
MPGEGRVKLARMIFAELTRDDASSKSPLPPGVKLRAVSFAGRRITLNLSREIISGLANTGSRDEMLAVYGLVNTYLKNFPDCSEVQIKVEGRPVKTLAGHIEVNKPLAFFTEGGGHPFSF